MYKSFLSTSFPAGRMHTILAKNFSLRDTVESGQIFRWHHDPEGFFHITCGSTIIKIRQKGNIVEYDCSNSGFGVKKFFGLEQDYRKIIESITKDDKIAAAVKKHHGLRLLEQDVWECTASFICSSFSNIPRIKKCIQNICTEFGNKISLGSYSSFSFPQPHHINDLEKLKKCGLGYRVEYLYKTAAMFSREKNKYSLPQLRKLGYEGAKKRLMELPGVGQKVADCILLFSCGYFESFPVDVWILRTMKNIYGKEIAAAAKKTKKITEKATADFARSYFGKYSGYAQQFLYHYSRSNNLRF
jgi:N-glycosylase/DNA lyase